MLIIGKIISHAKAPPEKTIRETFLPIINPTDIRAGDKDIPKAKVDLKKIKALEKIVIWGWFQLKLLKLTIVIKKLV